MDHAGSLVLSALQLGLAGASIVAWLAIVERGRRAVPLATTESHDVVPWNGADVAVLALAALALELAAQAVASHGQASDQLSLANVMAVAVSRIIWILLALVVLSVQSGAPVSRLGFDLTRPKSDLRLAGFLFAAAVLPVYGTQRALNTIFKLESDHPLVTLVEAQQSVGVLALVTLVAVFVAPLVEEFLFRVLLQGWLEKRQVASSVQHDTELLEGHRRAPGYSPIIVSSLLFGLLHVGHGADPIPLFVLGLFLGYAYRQTHRILAPLVIHMLVNGVAILELWIIYLRGAN